MNKTQLYSSVKAKIKQRRLIAENKAEAVLEECMLDTAFKTNYQNIKNLKFDIAKLEFQKQDTTMQKQLLSILEKERKTILEKLNKTEKDFLPAYTCKKCCDTGVYKKEFCSCFKYELSREINKELGTTINPEHCFKNMCNENKKAFALMEEWCAKFPASKYKNLVFTGGTGVGKTFLTECIANALLDKSTPLHFSTAFNLNNQCLKYHTSFEKEKSDLLEPFIETDVLFIDDLGTEPIFKNVTIEYLYLIINERITKNLSTIITTNLTPNEIINRYGERIFSRLFNKANSLLINLSGKDMRLKK